MGHVSDCQHWGSRERRRSLMPTYVTLLSWTDQGVRNVRETVQRGDSAVELAQKHGGSLQLYWTVGTYDLVGIL
jgi:uncharacterized protein with GYD domain